MALFAIALFGVAVTTWTIYYGFSNHLCFEAPSPTACESWVPLEKLACDHELPDTWMLGSCGQLAARHFFGVGRPADAGQSIAFSRRDCLSSLWGDVGSCVMTWSSYGEAYFEPHYVMSWGKRFRGPDYSPNWARPVDEVMSDAQAACKSGFVDDGHPQKLMDLLAVFCAKLPAARAARDDAAREAGDLARRCNARNANACHLLGLITAFGIGVPRRVQQGRELLRRACELGSAMGCDHSTASDSTNKALARLEAATNERVSSPPVSAPSPPAR